MKDKLIIIDGNSLINRAFYALPLLSNGKGDYSNGVYGFANILIKAILEVKPKYIAVALDYGKKTFRNKLYENYKGTRKPTPEELKSQFPILKKMLSVMNVKFIEVENFEADDVLGTLTKLFNTHNIIITGDRDALQLVSDNTELWLTKKGISEIKNINGGNFFAEYGLSPEQMIDLKALMGDSSDNIPGVRGVGEKTALELMKTYNSLDNIYANIENIAGKLKEKLLESKQMAYLSKELSRIKTDMNLSITLKDLEYTFPFDKDVREFFEEYDFNSLLKRNDLFLSPKIDKNYEKYSANIVEITDITMLEKQIKYIKKSGRLNFEIDGETFRFSYDKNCEFFVNISNLSSKTDQNNAIENTQTDLFSRIDNQDFAQNIEEKLSKDYQKSHENDAKTSGKSLKIDSFLHYFALIFEDENIKKTLFDTKTIKHFLKTNAGINLLGVDFDVALAYYLLVAGEQNATKQNLLSHYSLSAEYGSLNLFYLKEYLQRDLEKAKLTGLYQNIEFPLIDVLYDMENVGFKVDKTVLKDLKNRYEIETYEMEQTIKRLGFSNAKITPSFIDDDADAEKLFIKNDVTLEKNNQNIDENATSLDAKNFNVNSPKQLATLLFDKLKLTVAGNKKRSTNSEILEEMFDLHPIIPAIIRYRKIKKILTTYIEPYEKMLQNKTSLIHTSFNQTLTATGRLSSSEPNLQNIPVRDDEGRNLRKMFVTRHENGALVSADYSQIELRLLAHMSGDEKLIDAFNRNIDIHTLTASEVFHVNISEVTPKMRRMAKAVNFGIIYGISDFGLAQNIGTSRKKAKIYIEEYFEHYPKIKAYMDNNILLAKNSGFARSIFNRRRKVLELLSPNYNTRQFGERVAMNMPLQGSASDIIKLAMINVSRKLKELNLNSKLILQVHDELIIDAPQAEITTVSKLLKDEMESAVELCVPLTVDVNAGKTWFDC